MSLFCFPTVLYTVWDYEYRGCRLYQLLGGLASLWVHAGPVAFALEVTVGLRVLWIF